MGREEAKALWEQVKENQAKLNNCPCHKFGNIIYEPGSLISSYTCQVCGGKLRMNRIIDYMRGYRAAGKSTDNIATFNGETLTV